MKQKLKSGLWKTTRPQKKLDRQECNGEDIR